MALPSTSVFEVRPGAGSDTACGGGFDSAKGGTDYSQQNSAQYTFSDLASISSLVVSSASHNFVSTDVGNFMQITAGTGFTTGFYEIVSVSANQATLDRSPGTVGTGGTYFVGGALATISKAISLAVASCTVYVKASGNYTTTSAQAISLDSSLAPGNPFTFIGYTTTRTDNGQVTWTTATNSIDLIDFNQAKNVMFKNFIFSSTAGTPGPGWLSGATGSNNAVGIYAINCKWSGFSVGIEGNFTVKWAFSGLYLINCRVTGCTSHGIRNGGFTFLYGTISDNNTGDGLNTATTACADAGWVLIHSILYKNSANGFNVAFSNSGGATIKGIVLVNCISSTNTSAGLLLGNATNPLTQLVNCIFDANGTYGIDASSGTTTVPILSYNLAFYNNTTAATRNTLTGIGTITLTANPYTTIGTDFSLNSTAGGGTALKALGFPGVLQFGGTGYIDIGVLQTLGGGGVVNINVMAADLVWFAD